MLICLLVFQLPIFNQAGPSAMINPVSTSSDGRGYQIIRSQPDDRPHGPSQLQLLSAASTSSNGKEI